MKKKNKQQNNKKLTPEQQKIDEIIKSHSNQTDAYGNKVKARNQVVLLDEDMLLWRRRLLDHSNRLAMIYIIASLFIGGLLLFFANSLASAFLISTATIGICIGIYMLLAVKQKYISNITNSLQIPFFNKVVGILRGIQSEEGIQSLSDVSSRNSLKPYKSYIMSYVSYKKNDDIDGFIEFLQKIPQRLRSNLAITMQGPFIKLANTLFNTKKIIIKRQNNSKKVDPRRADGSMKNVSLQAIARDGKVKRGGRAKNVQEAIRELELMQESKQFLLGAKFRQTAPWYMKLFSDEQLDAMLEMQMTPKQMARWQKNRIMTASIIAGFIITTVVVCGILSPIIPDLSIASNPIYGFGGLLFGFFYYQLKGRQISKSLNGWRFKRRMAFAQLTQLLVPYLFLMKAHGGSLVEVFHLVANRLENSNDRALVVRLIRDMQNDPNSDIPFTRFAKAFTDDPGAVIFMTAINRAAQTKGNTDVIEDLAQRAQAQLLEKVGQIAKIKEGRMVILPTYVSIIGMLINLTMVMTAMMYQMTAAMG